jgi:DNA-binding transcriptional LysR family regulator
VDITLARTFLEIVSSHSFVHAAERLNVTQTAVSARVKALEDLLGRKLFVRNRAGATLTPAGELAGSPGAGRRRLRNQPLGSLAD